MLDAAGLDAAPRVVAVQGDRVIAGAGDTIYTTEVTAAHKVWQLFRQGKPLLDPDTRKPIAYEAMFVGSARLERGGDPAHISTRPSRPITRVKGNALISSTELWLAKSETSSG